MHDDMARELELVGSLLRRMMLKLLIRLAGLAGSELR
jgi:hypothetical protein